MFSAVFLFLACIAGLAASSLAQPEVDKTTLKELLGELEDEMIRHQLEREDESDEMAVKRATMNFYGSRGKKAGGELKRNPMPFIGSRGRRADKLGFYGSRGKRVSVDDDDLIEEAKRGRSLGFLGSRGRRANLNFIGSRGRR